VTKFLAHIAGLRCALACKTLSPRIAGAGDQGNMSSVRSTLYVLLIATIVSGCAEQKSDLAAEEQKNQQILNAYSHLTKLFDDCVIKARIRQVTRGRLPRR
jgi:hypothetical protein